MPLIIITGTPCSGKTFRAQQILQEFRSRIERSNTESHRSVVHLSSRHASLDPPTIEVDSYVPPDRDANPRDVLFNSARQEKIARAEEFSAIKRALSKNAIVIADGPNYIKGFRYQLFCEAKAAGTRSIVLHTAAREDESVEWNNLRLNVWDWPIDADQVAGQETKVVQLSGPKIGGNVLGDLDPESHTAIYGDKVVSEDTRSRTSSTGAAVSEGEADESVTRRHIPKDTMTLKSLYINDSQLDDDSESQRPDNLPSISEAPQTQTQQYLSPSSDPPQPRSSLPYTPSTLKSLHMRYEPPSPFTRWDTPLFTIPSTDPHPPYAQIWSALFPGPTNTPSKKGYTAPKQRQEKEQEQQESAPTPSTQTPDVRPNAATTLPTATTPNALQTLESTTGELTKLILAAARAASIADDGSGGTLTFTIAIPGTSDSGTQTEDLTVTLEVPEGIALSQPVLQRARRKYTQLQRGGIAHGQGYTRGRRGVVEGFVRFLEGEWGVDVDG